MSETNKERILRYIENAKGSDLERAKLIFGKLDAQELNQPYGYSGRTPAQILEEYEKERFEWLRAYEYAKWKLSPTPARTPRPGKRQ